LKRRLRECLPVSGANQPGTDDFYRLMENINRVHHKALFQYRLTRQPGAITLFKAMERNFYVEDTRFLGWSRYAEGGVKVHNIPGDHVTMFQEPNCWVLALELDKALKGL
jgi:thioesterase domain-containing protein